MSTEPRDTQFLGFAKGLWKDLEAHIDFIPEGQTGRKTFLPMVERIIAQHAYDLVAHACEAVEDKEQEYESRITSSYMASIVPDLPILPEEKV